MEEKNLYAQAHLFVAAIRVLEHQQAAPPALESVCGLLSISLEEGNRLCRKLLDLEVIGLVEKTGDIHLFIKDHVKLEQIPLQQTSSSLADELMRFKKEKEADRKSLETLRAQQEEKKKKLHEALARKLKDGLKPSG